MLFTVIVFLSVYIARKLGWGLSRLLYRTNLVATFILLTAWGCAIAFGFRLLLDALHPSLVIKIVAFGAASYAAIPNYGLLVDGIIPEHVRPRHLLISNWPMLTFIVASVLLVYPIKLTTRVLDRTEPLTPTVADLGRLAKRKYPGSYDDISDAELGRLVKKKYPGSYENFLDIPATQAQPPAAVAPNAIQPQPSQVSRLSDEQLTRVRIIQRALANVDNSGLEKWIADFEKDDDPENEITTWESIVDAYQRYCSARQLTNTARRDVLKVLITRSWTDDETEVLKQINLSALTQTEALQAMRLYRGPLSPIEVEKR